MRSLAALLLLPLVACSGSEGTPAKQALPTHKVGNAGNTAGLDGVLRGSAASECLWVENNGHRSDVSWPGGYTMSVVPLALRDKKGRIVVREGERVALTGGFRQKVSPTRCSDGKDAFFADYASRQK